NAGRLRMLSPMPLMKKITGASAFRAFLKSSLSPPPVSEDPFLLDILFQATPARPGVRPWRECAQLIPTCRRTRLRDYRSRSLLHNESSPSCRHKHRAPRRPDIAPTTTAPHGPAG